MRFKPVLPGLVGIYWGLSLVLAGITGNNREKGRPEGP